MQTSWRSPRRELVIKVRLFLQKIPFSKECNVGRKKNTECGIMHLDSAEKSA